MNEKINTICVNFKLKKGFDELAPIVKEGIETFLKFLVDSDLMIIIDTIEIKNIRTESLDTVINENTKWEES